MYLQNAKLYFKPLEIPVKSFLNSHGLAHNSKDYWLSSEIYLYRQVLVTKALACIVRNAEGRIKKRKQRSVRTAGRPSKGRWFRQPNRSRKRDLGANYPRR